MISCFTYNIEYVVFQQWNLDFFKNRNVLILFEKKLYILCWHGFTLFFSSDPGEFEIRKPKTVFPMKFLFMPQDMESYVFGAESSRYLREVIFTQCCSDYFSRVLCFGFLSYKLHQSSTLLVNVSFIALLVIMIKF